MLNLDDMRPIPKNAYKMIVFKDHIKISWNAENNIDFKNLNKVIFTKSLLVEAHPIKDGKAKMLIHNEINPAEFMLI